jgi:hypothetical protein
VEKVKPVKQKLNEWYNWLVSHVPKLIRKRTTDAFRKFKARVLALYPQPGEEVEVGKEGGKSTEKELDFTPIEHAFDERYSRFRIAGGKIDVETYFLKIRQNMLDLIGGQVKELGSLKIQSTVWIKWRKEEESANVENIVAFVEKAFNSKMTEVFQGSDFDEVLWYICSHEVSD